MAEAQRPRCSRGNTRRRVSLRLARWRGAGAEKIGGRSGFARLTCDAPSRRLPSKMRRYGGDRMLRRGFCAVALGFGLALAASGAAFADDDLAKVKAAG